MTAHAPGHDIQTGHLSHRHLIAIHHHFVQFNHLGRR